MKRGYLTNQQKSRIRRAYRATLSAEKGQKAIGELHKKFGELYGVSPDVLSKVIYDDLRSNPQKYKQSALSKDAAQPAKQQPSATQPRKATKPRKAKCRTCGRSVSVDHKGNFVNHVKAGRWCRGGSTPVVKPPRPKATCRECDTQRGVRETDGRIISHRGPDGSKCSGSGRTPSEGRGGGYMTLTPAKVISAGLPGLGKKR